LALKINQARFTKRIIRVRPPKFDHFKISAGVFTGVLTQIEHIRIIFYVGVRRGDAARLGKQHIRNNIVHLMTEKSQGKMPIYVPVHPVLAVSIAACPSPGLAIICKDDGTHYTKEGLGNYFREAVEAAGIPATKKRSKEKGYSGHGLRKASATIAAESGATEAELNAMFGWSGHQMAQLYTKNADRKRLAAPRNAEVDAIFIRRGGGGIPTRIFATRKGTPLEQR
jgi:integrase